MKLSWQSGVLCFAFLVSSCVPTLRGVQVPIPSERIFQKGYSLVPLNEKGWVITRRDPYGLILGKNPDNPDETFVILANHTKLPAFKSNEDLVGLVKQEYAKNIDPSRLKIVIHEVTAYIEKGPNCARTHVVAEDHAALKRSGKRGLMILEELWLTCAHPKDNNIGVFVTYSHRYDRDQRDPKFLDKATMVLSSVEFTDL